MVESESLLCTTLAQASCNHSALATECTGLTPVQAEAERLHLTPTGPRATHGTPSGAPLVECQIALRCVHHGTFPRALPLEGCKNFVSFLTCTLKVSLLIPGSKTMVYNEAS